tara:strand:+ start:1952 stop:2992 length:1041 start_codon:yes stop_codon:yes gene_type:complete
MIKKFLKEHSMHKKIVGMIDAPFIFNLPYFFILWMVFVWGMAASYYSVGINDSLYFLTSFNFKPFLFFLGLSFFLGALNIKNQLDDLSCILDWKKSNDSYNVDLNYLYVCPNFISSKSSEIYYYSSILIGAIMIAFFSFWCLMPLFVYAFLNLFFYKTVISTSSFKIFVFRCSFRLINVLLLFLSGWIYFGNLNLLNIIAYIPLFIMAVLPILLINEVVSYDSFSKKESDNRKFIYNNRKSIAGLSLIVMIFLFLCSFCIISIPDPITSHFSIITIPFLCYAFFRSSKRDFIRSYNYPIMIMNVLLSWTLFPLLFLAQFIVYYFSKYYYWHRFNVHFPKFIIEQND